jgi:HSP20 family protein
MELTLWKPLRGLSQRRNDVDRMFDRFWGTPFFDVRPTSLVPPLEVTENDNEILIKMELAGVDEKDVDVTLAEGTLVIKGEKKQESEEQNDLCYCSERSFGSFERNISVPSTVDGEHVSAKFDKGILSITLPKLEETKPKKVEIKVV